MPNYTRREVVETYQARGDDDGRPYTITVYAEVIYTETMDGTKHRNIGLKSHKIGDGGRVNVQHDGALFEVATGRVMHQVHP
jgi:hypothetical protein